MKTKILCTASFIAAALTANAYASDGTITFTGKIQDASCTIQTDNVNQIIPLGLVSSKAFKAAGDLASVKTFSINLLDCPSSITSVSIRFDGETDPSAISNGKLLKNDATTGAAGNVAIGIWNDSGPISLANVLGRGEDSTAVTIDTSAGQDKGTAKLPFAARFVSTAAGVTPGDVHAVSQFTVMYN